MGENVKGKAMCSCESLLTFLIAHTLMSLTMNTEINVSYSVFISLSIEKHRLFFILRSILLVYSIQISLLIINGGSGKLSKKQLCRLIGWTALFVYYEHLLCGCHGAVSMNESYVAVMFYLAYFSNGPDLPDNVELSAVK